MKDPQGGGLYWQVDLAGRPRPPFVDEKNAYGLSFAIYAGATLYAATKESRALMNVVTRLRKLAARQAADPGSAP